MKSILLTGAGGFLGRQLLWQLKDEDDFYVYAITSNPERLKEIISASNIKVVKKGDDLDWKNVDIVIHSAFARSGISSEYITSLEYSKDIFQNAVSNRVKAIINISSQSVYGNNQNIPWKEDAMLMPQDMYAMAKASSEIILNVLSEKSSTVATNLRLSSIMLNTRFVNVFVQNAIDYVPINIIGGTQQFSFMDIRDAASAIIELIRTSQTSWDKVYNLGTGKQNSIIEIADIIRDVAKSYVEKKVIINIEKKDIPPNSYMDIRKFTELTNWSAKYDICDMVKSQFEYLFDKKQKGENIKFSNNYPFTYLWQ